MVNKVEDHAWGEPGWEGSIWGEHPAAKLSPAENLSSGHDASSLHPELQVALRMPLSRAAGRLLEDSSSPALATRSSKQSST
jgi:hypothetical protein